MHLGVVAGAEYEARDRGLMLDGIKVTTHPTLCDQYCNHSFHDFDCVSSRRGRVVMSHILKGNRGMETGM